MVRRRQRSPRGRLVALAKRVQSKLDGSDAALAAPLAPAVRAARSALSRGRVDALSAEGRRVELALQRVEARLDASAEEERAQREQEAADELVHEMEAALEAAEETLGVAGGARGKVSRER
jgi:hypothetical protein